MIYVQYIPRYMHTVFALLCFVVVIHWLIFPYPPGLLHWHCGILTIAPVPAKQPWWIWINTSCEFIMNDCITTKKYAHGFAVLCFAVGTLGYHWINYTGTTLADAIGQWSSSGNPVLIYIFCTIGNHWKTTGATSSLGYHWNDTGWC